LATKRNAPEHDAITLCANSEGKPWTVSGFRASWRKYRITLERKNRINPGTRALWITSRRGSDPECRFDERTIADALGQKTIEMARLYARGADLTKKMQGVAKEFEREANRRRTKVPNLARKVSNPRAAARHKTGK